MAESAAVEAGVAATAPEDSSTQTAPSPATPRALSEASWVARAQDGDAAAFTHLVRTYEGELFRLGYRILSDRGDAEDMVQDVLVIVWRKLPSLSDPQAFRSWIYQIATRQCLQVSQRRSKQRTDVAAGEDLSEDAHAATVTAPGHENPSDVVQATAIRHGLDRSLAELPADQRTCWVLLHLHDLTYAQIAYATGERVSTVRGRISRARQNLAKGMTEWQ